MLANLVVGGLAGLMTGGAFAGPAWSPLAMAGLVVVTYRLPGADRLGTALTCVSFAIVFIGVTMSWLWSAVGPGAWAGVTAAESLFVAAAVGGMRIVAPLRGGPIWAASIWTAAEAARSSWPLGGLPWGRLGYAALDTPAATLLPLVGVGGTGLAMVTAAAWLGFSAARPTGRRQRLSVALASGIAVSTALSAWSAAGPWPDVARADTARVAVVPGSVPGGATDLIAHHREVTSNLAHATVRWASTAQDESTEVDFVLWPENSTAVDPDRDNRSRDALDRAVAGAGSSLLAGIIAAGDDGSIRNQAVAWTSAGAAGRYTKQHLVPFGEYVPWRPVAERLSKRVAAIERDMTPGPPTATPLPVGGVEVANAICFDVAYGRVVAEQVAGGAELVAVQTSNAMFRGTAQSEQQWAISRVRALETGRSVVVASVNGISGAIGSDGSVIARLDGSKSGQANGSTGATDVVVVEVPLASSITPAVRWSQAVPWIVAILAMTGVALAAGKQLPRATCYLLPFTKRGRRQTQVRATPKPVSTGPSASIVAGESGSPTQPND